MKHSLSFEAIKTIVNAMDVLGAYRQEEYELAKGNGLEQDEIEVLQSLFAECSKDEQRELRNMYSVFYENGL
ncbi:hypothetical protein IMZ31_23915 (plasmid) [Pontibacillus sp. ALD_SL1]|uniref:hypothetical protein n=1 Tax=Pontibacillus sp. ALD_SL1 TaxID=2777185 RepID=UPI001A95EFB7|nr:hypothetical protein [Pontibacillus sp. ALD_SL1]QST02500.1 hypothetical protein IMZ31_23915 [Pontibacillus sp. ALD_SL1]